MIVVTGGAGFIGQQSGEGAVASAASSASVYGGGKVFSEERPHARPLNVYGYCKFLFDQYARSAPWLASITLVEFPRFVALIFRGE